MCGGFVWDWAYPERRPHTGFLEYKNVYLTVSVVSFDLKKGNIPYKKNKK